MDRRLEPLWCEVREWLEQAKRALDEEIRTYPKPIPRCDAQFNHLIDARSRIAAMLSHTDGPLDDALSAFSAADPFSDDSAEQRLRDRIAGALARAATLPTDGQAGAGALPR